MYNLKIAFVMKEYSTKNSVRCLKKRFPTGQLYTRFAFIALLYSYASVLETEVRMKKWE